MKEFNVKVNDKDFVLFVRTPSNDEIMESDLLYSTKMSSLIRHSGKDRLLLRSELDSFLKANKVWTDADVEKYNELQNKINQNIVKLKKGGIKLSDGRKLAIDISDLRGSLIDLVQKRHQYEDMTMESQADEERTDFLIYSCTIDKETGDRYWVSFDDMKSDKSSDIYQKAKSGLIEVTMGLSSDLDSILPETMWLKKYKFVNNEYKLTDRKTGEFVDKSGKPVKKDDLLSDSNNYFGEIIEEEAFVDDYV